MANAIPKLIRVLVVDDDPIDRRAVRRALTESFEIHEVENGRQACKLLNRESPDCVLLDFRIPGTDTFALLEEIRSRCPVIMMTGEGNESVAVEAMKAGASDYLSKIDFTPKSLQQAIYRAINKMVRRRAREDARNRLQTDYREERQKRQALETAEQVAHDIQQNLMPAESPDL